MLALSKKSALFLLILLSALVALVITITVIHATNPLLWQHLASGFGPYIWNHF